MDQALTKLVLDMRGQTFHNYITPGLSSSLLTQGKVRLFEATRHHQFDITPHSHRFDFACLVLRGMARHSVWSPADESKMAKDGDTFALMEVGGNFEDGYRTAHHSTCKYLATTKEYHSGDWYFLSHTEIHSVEFARGTVVLFLEGPPAIGTTLALFPVDHNNQPMNTLAIQPWMFQAGEPL
jgi:hypothetical protein